LQTTDEVERLSQEAVDSENNDLTKTILAPSIIDNEDGKFSIWCEKKLVCTNLSLIEAAATMISLFYAVNAAFPKSKKKTLQLLAFLCGIDNGELSAVTKNVINFLQNYVPN
jgi:hypothetical protein